MAQGEFTKQKAAETSFAVKELFEAIPQTLKEIYVEHLNEILLFIDAAKKVAPDKPEANSQQPVA
jgi:uncharacterized glyoxalase superfamily metalloenzyme YdcJ